MKPLRLLVQLSILKCGQGILDTYTQLNSLKTKWIQRLLSPTNVYWKDLKLHSLDIILNSNQGFILFRQTYIFRSNRYDRAQRI